MSAVNDVMGTMSIGHWLIVLWTLPFYFTPSIVGVIRKVKPIAGIIILNFFLGWTGLGWVGALVWAAIAEKKPEQGAANATRSL